VAVPCQADAPAVRPIHTVSDCLYGPFLASEGLCIRFQQKGTGEYEPCNGNRAAGDYALVFHKYANRYFLAEVRIADGTVYMLPQSKLERELRAQNMPTRKEVLLASRK